VESLLQSVSTRRPGELVKIKNYLSNLIMSAFQSFSNIPVRSDFEDVILNAPSFCAAKNEIHSGAFQRGYLAAYIAEHFHYRRGSASASYRIRWGSAFSTI
jgi:hypothetical protein